MPLSARLDDDPSIRLIGHALATEWRALAASTRAAAQAFLFDTLAVGIAGAGAAFSTEVLASTRLWAGGPGDAIVLGEPGLRLPAPQAAFVNAYRIHAQEFDCVHEPAVAHPMATVVAALLAEAGRSPCDGPDFLAAIVAGVDVVATLGIAARGPLKFFRPATAGIFGSIAAIARLRRLDPAVAADAFGQGLAFAGGTMQAHVEGKPTLALQVAAAARGAVEAIDLARAGIPGPQGSIGGEFGLMALFENDVALTPALDRLGRGRRIEEVSWKPFPTGRAAHGAIVALSEMMTRDGVGIDTLARLTYRAPPLIRRLVGRAPVDGMSVAYARLCFPWLGAVLLREGTIGLEDFTPAKLADPALHDLAGRFSIEADDNSDLAAFTPAIACADLRDGRRIEICVEHQFGTPQWPLSLADQMAKARTCLAFGGLDADRAVPLHDLVERLVETPDVARAIAGVIEA